VCGGSFGRPFRGLFGDSGVRSAGFPTCRIAEFILQNVRSFCIAAIFEHMPIRKSAIRQPGKAALLFRASVPGDACKFCFTFTIWGIILPP
jgi:hypothetical protein